MYYYRIIPADSVSKSVREAGWAGARAAAIVLGMNAISPRWMVLCTKEDWARAGSNDVLTSLSPELGGLAHKTSGIYINANISVAESVECGIHESFHAYQFRNNMFSGGKPSDVVAMAERHAQDFTNGALRVLAGILVFKNPLVDTSQNAPSAPYHPPRTFSRAMSIREMRRLGRC